MQQTEFEKEVPYVSFDNDAITIQRKRTNAGLIFNYSLLFLIGAVFGISSYWGGQALLGLVFAIGSPLLGHLKLRTLSRTKCTAINFVQQRVKVEDISGNGSEYALKDPTSFNAEVVQRKVSNGYENTLFIQFDEVHVEAKMLGSHFRQSRETDQIRLLALLLNEGIKSRQAPVPVFYSVDAAQPTETQCLYYTPRQRKFKTVISTLTTLFWSIMLVAVSVPVLLVYAAIVYELLS